MTRNRPTTGGASTHDAGRIASQRAIENSSLTKWLDGLKTQSAKDADEMVEWTQEIITATNTRGRTAAQQRVDKKAMEEIDRAMETMEMHRTTLEVAKALLQTGVSAEQVGNAMEKDTKAAKQHLAGEKVKSLHVSGENVGFGKPCAERAALEFAKGTFTQPTSQR